MWQIVRELVSSLDDDQTQILAAELLLIAAWLQERLLRRSQRQQIRRAQKVGWN